MSHPLVSIIIPCYNAEQYVGEAIQSALNQTYPNCEIIVIDDGSTDGTLNIVKKFDDKIQWVSGPNEGGGAARNRGIELAKGEWIQFLDADDELMPGCVQTKLTHLGSSDEVICSKLSLHPDSTDGELSEKWTLDVYDLKNILRIGSPATPTPLHRRENLIKIDGFDRSLQCCQEFDLHLRLKLKLNVRFRVINEVGVLIRTRNDSVSRHDAGKIPLFRARVFNKLSQSDEALLKRNAEEFSRATINLARTLWRMDKHVESLQMYHIARNLTPNWWKYGYRTRMSQYISKFIGFQLYERFHSYARH